jgi:hypothetical protein
MAKHNKELHRIPENQEFDMDDKRLIILDTRPKRTDAHSREILSLQQVTHSDYELTIVIKSKNEESIEDDNDQARITFTHYAPSLARDWLQANDWMNDRI